ncbi:cell cycle arrest protein BUB3 [Candida albicans P57072]|uniref:Bub3p n=1 Tax=Candida albicans (strain WO-1) TaxID=294748 RepID=C4YRK0_CANAW|nr:conserved hypothetical protein [Candida albicans WO-1]KGR05759.1 cell cycle arrest protein BUB3 [Candida albicans P57072]KGU26880.1 cell cycle arrest protein BUB3 [Candida albicans P57055]KHC32833.1 cell cycle arrest protein BUB3 [Candida albicans P76055]KHC32902.1 cell cycle arrest protein BUB3 [Candida albicans P76067]KHC48670.1 cell cycle arrest protein BUB3 [Candida albicans P60002]KHC72937.1 cell cycle arrest protein BUB3 [Candida albicans P78042]
MTTPFVELQTPKNLDIISDVCFMDNTDQHRLLVSNWNSEILLFSCDSLLHEHQPPHLQPINTFTTPDIPLCLLYDNKQNVSPLVGLLDGSIRELDFENGKLGDNIGDAVDDNNEIDSGINNLKNVNISGQNSSSIVASSFNGKLQLIDTRQSQRQQQKLSPQTFHNQRKIFTMDTSDQYLILGLQNNIIEIYDFKNLHHPLETRQVGLKYQIKDLKTFPDNQGFALSTIDGRVSMEYFNPDPQFQLQNRFTFKCHRHPDPNPESAGDLVYPVNSLDFNHKYGTLFTAGSDGYVCLWDCKKRKRMRQYPRFLSAENEPESIVKLQINRQDNLMVVATSDDNYKRRRRLSESENSKTPSRVYVKQLAENECKPKS